MEESDGYDLLMMSADSAGAEKAFITQARDKWKEYEHSVWRHSKWRTKTGQIIPVPQLETSHIQHILTCKFPTPLPQEWRHLLETELQFRKVDFKYFDELIAAQDEILKVLDRIF